jgi:uncharacterized protein (TIGR00255 family)
MTAFARVQKKLDDGEIVWEIRSVNHRYLEQYLKIPDEFRVYESRYRDVIQHRLKRGKVECTLRYKADIKQNEKININQQQAKSLVTACQEINNLLHQPSEVNPLAILEWPGVVQEADVDMKPVLEASVEALNSALDELIANREREGSRLHEMLARRCKAIQKIVDQIRKELPEILSRYQQRLRDRMAEIKVEVNSDRLEQELVHLAQKMDVDEELDRLDSHLKELNDVLDRDEAIGRRLDFLMQELNREANTLGSKSADISSTNASVELKVLIEQMREQIQNIE